MKKPPTLAPCLLAMCFLFLGSCRDRRPALGKESPRDAVRNVAPTSATYEAAVAEGVGVAVEIVVDTSGSMRKRAPDDVQPKYQVARQAIQQMLSVTDAFRKKKPDFRISVGLMHFSSDAYRVLPIQPYDANQLDRALRRIPKPGGGTAIGTAMHKARRELYRGGAYRKYMIVVTDGQNGSGPDPALVAREIHERSEGGVQFYFVAFDTDPRKFGFLKAVGGEVIQARNGMELTKALKNLYEGKILAEADYGETELYDPRKEGTPK